MKKLKHNPIFKVILLWLIWRVCTYIIGFFALDTIPFTITFADYRLQAESSMPISWERWSNFDGGSYMYLAEKGYIGVGLLQAYFPLYPFLIAIISTIISWLGVHGQTPMMNTRMIVGLAVSSVCSLLFLITLYKYLRLRFDEQFSFLCLLIYMVFPTAFFFHAYYTESLFMLLVMLVFYFSQKKQWFACMIFLALATATRIVGVFLIPALMFELYAADNSSWNIKALPERIRSFIKQQWLPLLLLSLGSIGLLSYMVYLFIYFKDPLLFFHVQSEFGAGREEKIILFPQVVWRYIKIVWTARPFDLKYFTYIQEFVSAMVGLGILVGMMKYFKQLKLRISELLYAIGAFFLPTLTGNFSSMGRYLLVCFPIFIAIAAFLYKRRKTQYLYILVSIFFLIINIIMFIQGRWVA